MTVLFRGKVLKAYVEIDPDEQTCSRILLLLGGAKWIELTGVQLEDGFLLPSPIGCECVVSDFSERQLDYAKYEVEFASSYSRDGVFWAMQVRELDNVQVNIQYA